MHTLVLDPNRRLCLGPSAPRSAARLAAAVCAAEAARAADAADATSAGDQLLWGRG